VSSEPGAGHTAIAAEIVSLADEKRKADTAAGRLFLDKALGAGKILLRSGLKLGVKAATVGALDAADLKEIAKDVAAETTNVADKYLGEFLTRQKEQKNALQAFRDALSDLSISLADGTKKPLVFIIDELDRCRPSFALETLERIKHFFSVPNVLFVLGTHLDQLKNSVIVTYGPEVDARTYLQKFINLTVHLSDQAGRADERTTSRFIAYLRKAMEFRVEDGETIEYATEMVRHVAEGNNLSLRTIEHIMTTLAVALAYTPPKYFRPPPILGGLCVLKVCSPDLYIKAKRGELQYAEVNAALGLHWTAPSEQGGRSRHFADWWKFCTSETVEKDVAERFQQGLFRYGIDDRREIVPWIANDVIDRLSPRE